MSRLPSRSTVRKMLPRRRWDMTGKTVVISGAGGGIGRALAVDAAGRGARLALSDVDERGLTESAALARAAGASDVATARVDVTDRDAVHAWADEVAAEFGAIHLVIANAGITHIGSVLESSYEDLHKVVDVDFWGVVHCTKEFLPHLIASGDGHLANISSLFALMASPFQSSYCASKFAVQGFTESLAMELDMTGEPVDVTCVHPGGIKTSVARSAGSSRDAENVVALFDSVLARHSAEKAAKIILDGVVRHRRRVLIGDEAYFMDVMTRVMPARYQRMVALGAGAMGME